MNGNGQSTFFYLNRDNRWLQFDYRGLERGPDGALRLAALPLFEGTLPPALAALPPPSGPAGVALGPDGSVYFSDPAHHRLLKIDGCDGSQAPIACAGGEGRHPGQLRQPRGLLFHPLRQALFVADSGNHRIQIFDRQTFQLISIWGQPDFAGDPLPGSQPGRLDTPWALAGDDAGDLYVVDYGNRRVQKFNRMGEVVPAFWEAIQAQSAVPQQPSDIAVVGSGPSTTIYILDASARTVFLFDAAGTLIRSFSAGVPQLAIGLAATADALYIGDNGRRRLLQFSLGGTLVGEARGYAGPLAALALDPHAGIFVHSGGELAPLRLSLAGAYVRQGLLWSTGPLRNQSSRPEQWHLLEAMIAPLLPGTHLQLFVASALNDTPPPFDPLAPEPFAAPSWQRMPLDSAECLFPGAPFDYIWVGAAFSGEGLASPALAQLRLEFDHQTYLAHLPAIYLEDTRSRQFLARFLSLFQSLFSDVEGQIGSLAALFDPAAAPADLLDWLADWLALDVDGQWDAAQKRQAIATAFERYGRRGTASGLRQALREYGGVAARIEEPLLQAAWWALPEDDSASDTERQLSMLGFTTMLAPAEAQGAVVGTTATLDQSHLIAQEQFGAPLFTDLAYQFLVRVYRGRSYSEPALAELRTLIEREKPAHTNYHLCVIEPRMRVGLQSRVGLDTIVAGPPQPNDGAGLVLGGEPPGRIGRQSRVGYTTRLGETSVEA